MSTTIETPNSYAFSPAQVHAAFTTRDFWEHRVTHLGSIPGTVESFDVSDGAVTVVVNEKIAVEELPQAMANLFTKGLRAIRTINWTALTDDKATGTFAVEIPAAQNGKVEGTFALSPAEEGAQILTVTTVTIKIPMVGPMMEQKLGVAFEEILANEATVLSDWLAAHAA